MGVINIIYLQNIFAFLITYSKNSKPSRI